MVQHLRNVGPGNSQKIETNSLIDLTNVSFETWKCYSLPLFRKSSQPTNWHEAWEGSFTSNNFELGNVATFNDKKGCYIRMLQINRSVLYNCNKRPKYPIFAFWLHSLVNGYENGNYEQTSDSIGALKVQLLCL